MSVYDQNYIILKSKGKNIFFVENKNAPEDMPKDLIGDNIVLGYSDTVEWAHKIIEDARDMFEVGDKLEIIEDINNIAKGTVVTVRGHYYRSDSVQYINNIDIVLNCGLFIVLNYSRNKKCFRLIKEE